MKKLIAMLLTVVLCVSLAACGAAPQPAASQGGQPDPAGTGTPDASGAVVHLRLLCMNNVPTKEGTKQVQDALNAYLAGLGKNYTVSFDEFLDLASHQSGIDMALASGEDLGIVLTDFRTNVMAANGQLLPLNDYLDSELKGVRDLMGDEWLEAGSLNGTVYGVPVYKGVVSQIYLVYRSDIVKEIGYDMSTVKTIYDVENLLAEVKKAHPEMDGLVPADMGSLGLLLPQSGKNGYSIDFLGTGNFGNDANGVLFGDSTEVENFFASEPFAKMCAMAYDWNQKGLTMKEASVSPNVAIELFPAGTAFSTIVWNAAGPETVAAMYDSGAYGTSGLGFEAVALDKQMLTASTLGLQYGIASTCSCPREAADFLNLLWTDPAVMNLVVYGVEGTSYVVDENGIANWPEGLDVDTVPYSEINLCGAIGNQFNLKLFAGNSTEEDLVLMKELVETASKSRAMGFTFDASSVSTEMAAVQTVVDQYYFPLMNGEVDPEVYIPQFIEALNNAGMEKVISEKQTQLDEYLAK